MKTKRDNRNESKNSSSMQKESSRDQKSNNEENIFSQSDYKDSYDYPLAWNNDEQGWDELLSKEQQ